MNDQTAQTQPNNSYVEDYIPPMDPSQATDQGQPMSASQVNDQNTAVATDDNLDSPEDIESQNIFSMLGVSEGDEELKEKFLDQLQEVIWDDFLTNDVELLLTPDEFTEFKTYKQKVDDSQGSAQEEAKDAMVEYIEKLVPDLEDIMLEKALDLKADLFVERINGMKEYFAENQEKLAKVSQAEQHMYSDNWKSAAELLNEIQE